MLSNQELARQFITLTHRNIFITGKAGTGKTTFLQRLTADCKKQFVVLAPTGVAAINAGGLTLHSFFQLPLTPFLPTPEGRRDLVEKSKLSRKKRDKIKRLELIFIDEVSMVRADTMDAVDALLRFVRQCPDVPFGGVQVVCFGDMFQLPPVVTSVELSILYPYYDAMYFFNSHVIVENPLLYVEFDKVFRQSDNEFITLLNEVRQGELSERSYAKLQSRYNPRFKPSEEEEYIMLTTHNHKADRVNESEMAKLETPVYHFEASIEGEFPSLNYPVDLTLSLKKGARVMFVKNDHEHQQFFNGKMGVVSYIDKDTVFVQCAGEEAPIEVQPMRWDNTSYIINKKTSLLEAQKIGSFTQLPLRLAWAITIHKSQGLTFDKVVLDPADAFTAGQTYVALSRCRTLEGIILTSQIAPHALRNSLQVVNFSLRGKQQAMQLPEELIRAKKRYGLELLQRIFNFAHLESLFSRFLSILSADVPSLAKEFHSYLQTVKEQIAHLKEVGAKFEHHLTAIWQSKLSASFLMQRLQAASQYFTPHLNTLLSHWVKTPITTDNKEVAQRLDRYWRDAYKEIVQKIHAIEGVEQGFSVEGFFAHRAQLVLTLPKVTTYAPDRDTFSAEESSHPVLLEALSTLRKTLAEDENVPPFFIFNNKTLRHMTMCLPATSAELGRIKGIGEHKLKAYGKPFLEVINNYCQEYQVTERMTQEELLKPLKKKAPAKYVKGDSARSSLALYKQGKSIQEIATERNLRPSTVATHLGKFITNRELDIHDFISQETLERANHVLLTASDEESSYSILLPILTSEEITLFVAWRRQEPEE